MLSILGISKFLEEIWWNQFLKIRYFIENFMKTLPYLESHQISFFGRKHVHFHLRHPSPFFSYKFQASP
tara:strand:- start:577 stop:783 length:207 start_codon:yes stop_codon:yes gene_type:complete